MRTLLRNDMIRGSVYFLALWARSEWRNQLPIENSSGIGKSNSYSDLAILQNQLIGVKDDDKKADFLAKYINLHPRVLTNSTALKMLLSQIPENLKSKIYSKLSDDIKQAPNFSKLGINVEGVIAPEIQEDKLIVKSEKLNRDVRMDIIKDAKNGASTATIVSNLRKNHPELEGRTDKDLTHHVEEIVHHSHKRDQAISRGDKAEAKLAEQNIEIASARTGIHYLNKVHAAPSVMNAYKAKVHADITTRFGEGAAKDLDKMFSDTLDQIKAEKDAAQRLQDQSKLLSLGASFVNPIANAVSDTATSALEKIQNVYSRLAQEFRTANTQLSEMLLKTRAEMNETDKQDMAKYVENNKSKSVQESKKTTERIITNKTETLRQVQKLQNDKKDLTARISAELAKPIPDKVEIDKLKARVQEINPQLSLLINSLGNLKEFTDTIKVQIKKFETDMKEAVVTSNYKKAADDLMNFVDSLKDLEKLVQLTGSVAGDLNKKTLIADFNKTLDEIDQLLKSLDSVHFNDPKVVSKATGVDTKTDKTKKKLSPQETQNLKDTVIKLVAKAMGGDNAILKAVFDTSTQLKDLRGNVEKAVRNYLAGKGIDLSDGKITSIVNNLMKDIGKNLAENNKNFFGKMMGDLGDKITNVLNSDPLDKGLFPDKNPNGKKKA